MVCMHACCDRSIDHWSSRRCVRMLCLHWKETKEVKIGTGTCLGQMNVKLAMHIVCVCCIALCDDDDDGVYVCMGAHRLRMDALVRCSFVSVDQANSKILPSFVTPMVLSDAISMQFSGFSRKNEFRNVHRHSRHHPHSPKEKPNLPAFFLSLCKRYHKNYHLFRSIC
jgi:hypothetical protein